MSRERVNWTAESELCRDLAMDMDETSGLCGYVDSSMDGQVSFCIILVRRFSLLMWRPNRSAPL